MTRILYVTSDDDYGALAFEQSRHFSDLKGLWDKVKNTAKQEVVLSLQNPENEEEWDIIEVYVTAHEFEDIPPDFMYWIKNEVMDYDYMKNVNFYIVGDN